MVKEKRTDGGINDGEKVRARRRERKRECERERKRKRQRSVCRLLQSHCTTLEFQTRTLGRAESRAESRGEEREERQRGGGAKERAAS